jgi:putative endonuclease
VQQTLIVIAGLDPAIHADFWHEELLGLHSGEPPARNPYVGVTSNLVRRVYEHREEFVDGFTKQHSVKMLVYYEQHATAMAAVQREKNIKHWSRKWKIDLIR